MKEGKKYSIVELFAGAAGMAQGFLKSGHFELLALLDVNENAKRTFQANYPNIPYVVGDIREIEPVEFEHVFNGRKIDVLLGGPPCQGFSAAGLRDRKDERNALVFEYLRFVEYFLPDFLVIENVPNMLRYSVGNELISRLQCNYNVMSGIMNSAFYGTPQTRHRAIVIAVNKRLGMIPSLPLPTHWPVSSLYGYKSQNLLDESGLGELLGENSFVSRYRNKEFSKVNKSHFQNFITVEDALSDLMPLDSGCRSEYYYCAPINEYQRKLRSTDGIVHNHEARTHDERMLQLIGSIPVGGDLRNVDSTLWPKSFYSQAYGRLHPQGLARTITNSFQNPGSGRFLHYRDNRSLTVREAARLQGFSDNFKLYGGVTEQMTLVGNAVPIPLAEAIGNHVVDIYSERVTSGYVIQGDLFYNVM